MDFRAFITRPGEAVLPYLGGGSVTNGTHQYRVSDPPPSGWYRFGLQGRRAQVLEPSEPGSMDGCPKVLGHLASSDGHWMGTDEQLVRLHLLSEVPEILSPVLARRWYDGQLLFEGSEFEDAPEMAARQALFSEGSLDGIPGVQPSLRLAFAIALADRVARPVGARLSAFEALPRVVEISRQGRPAVQALISDLERRRQARRTARRQEAALSVFAVMERTMPTGVEATAQRALRRTGARLVQTRALRAGQFEVIFDFMGERFVSLVEEGSLRLIDSGICLDGTDDRLTLDSLPGAIKEAMEQGALCITRWT